MERKVDNVVIVVESVWDGRGSDEESFLEPEVRGAFEIGDLCEGAEEVRGTSVF